jgi:hypothetical protein
MSDADKASELRKRAKRLDEQAAKLARRAAAIGPGLQGEMLAAQAKILREGAAAMENDALAMDPALGTA